MEAMQRAYERKQLITGVPSGFVELDELTSGFQPGDLIIIAARPSVGKTSARAEHRAARRHSRPTCTVGVFSLEMSKEQLFMRMLTSEAQDRQPSAPHGLPGGERLVEAVARDSLLAEANIFIDDTPAIGLMSMRAKARRLQAERGLHLIVVDYIQLMQAGSRFDNRTLELGAISRSLKSLAKELHVPVSRSRS